MKTQTKLDWIGQDRAVKHGGRVNMLCQTKTFILPLKTNYSYAPVKYKHS